MIKIKPPERESDKHGQGHYGASRGSRTHRGVDLAMYPGSSVYANVSGTITKFGYPYGDDRSFKYVQITTEHNQEHRYFYVEPQKGLKVGDEIFEGQKIGTSQELGKRYEGITEHIHYEVRYKGGAYVDPNSYLLE